MPWTGVENPGHRKAWRFLVVLSCILSAATLLLSVVLFTKIQNNRVESAERTCLAIEDLKTDVRNTLLRFHTNLDSLPKHADGTRAFQKASVSCNTIAKNIVNPPNGDK
jgi:hypothetical protein